MRRVGPGARCSSMRRKVKRPPSTHCGHSASVCYEATRTLLTLTGHQPAVPRATSGCLKNQSGCLRRLIPHRKMTAVFEPDQA